MDNNDSGKTIKAYKGFKRDLTCRGFQYEIGKTFEIKGNITCCAKGFHACESPLDVFEYYNMLSSRFCEVEQAGDISRDGNHTKACSSKIKIVTELKLADMIRLGVEWLLNATSSVLAKGDVKSANDNYCDYAEIVSSDYCAKIKSSSLAAKIKSSGGLNQIWSIGDFANIITCGNDASIYSSGISADIWSSGNWSSIGSSGNSANIGSSSNYTKIGSSGDFAKIGSSGYYDTIGSSGDFAKISTSGNSTKIVSSGDYAIICASGGHSCIGSNGYCARIYSSGESTNISSNGDSANVSSSGECTFVESSGNNSVVCCTGHGSIAKAKKGSWITLAEWKSSTGEQRDIPVCVKTEYVDGERIKEDTWYRIENGEFIECKP